MANIKRRLSSRWLQFKLDHGMATRGRTDAGHGPPPVQAAVKGLFAGEVKITSHMLSIHLRKNPETGEYEEIGRRECRDAVTDAWVAFIIDQLQTESSEIGDFKFHDWGTGTNGAVAGDTALQTPCGEARTTGSQTEGATANIYRTVGLHTFAGTFAITEHGVFSQASGTTLMDRHTFSAINVDGSQSDQIQTTYELTLTAGG